MNALDTTIGPMSSTPVLRIDSPADLVEVVPYVLGVRPTDSLVALGLEGGPGSSRFTSGPALRHDLPPPARFALVARELTGMLARDGSTAVALLFHADTPDVATAPGIDPCRTFPPGVPAALPGPRPVRPGMVRVGPPDHDGPVPGPVRPAGSGGSGGRGRYAGPGAGPAGDGDPFPRGVPARKAVPAGEALPARQAFPARDKGPDGEAGKLLVPPVVTRLRALHEAFAVECRRQGVALAESLCVADGRWWSYVCRNPRCCPPDGTPVRTGRSSAVVAAAVCAGLPEPVPLAAIVSSFRPPEHEDTAAVTHAFDRIAADLTARAAAPAGDVGIRTETFALLQAVRARFRSGDRRLTDEQVARLVLGLADLELRDRAMAWEPDDGDVLLDLWTALARRSPGADRAAPLTLAAWVAWTTRRTEIARVALRLALEADPDYTMADLLQVAVNSPLCPDESRRALFPRTGTGEAAVARTRGTVVIAGPGARRGDEISGSGPRPGAEVTAAPLPARDAGDPGVDNRPKCSAGGAPADAAPPAGDFTGGIADEVTDDVGGGITGTVRRAA